MIRVVIDPGVYISALIGSRGGAPDRIVRAVIDDRIEAVSSPHLMQELELVLRRPRFAKYASADVVTEFVARIARHTTSCDDPPGPPPATRDPKDDYLVALARAQQVDAIISGDRDLLEAELGDVEVWSPRVAIEAIEPRRS